MQAYEFLTKPTNGIITIPEEFRRRITSEVRVIVLKLNNDTPDDATAVVRKSEMALSPTLDTRSWEFNREEANERYRRMEWLNRLEAAVATSADEDLPDWPFERSKEMHPRLI